MHIAIVSMHKNCVFFTFDFKGALNFTHEVQFTGHEEYYTVCVNSRAISSVALERAFQSLKKKNPNDIIRVWDLNKQPALQTGGVGLDI